MPCSLDAPLLKVNTETFHGLDPRDAKNLFSVWTVFTRCADSVSQGRRLENLSWRMWTRETFCVQPGTLPASLSTTSLPQAFEKTRSSAEELPPLSGSVDSVADDEAIEFTPDSSPMDSDRPRICRQDSCASNRSRGKERHLTADDFEKMVVDIVHTKEAITPLPLISLPIVVTPNPEQKPKREEAEPILERSGSTSDSEHAKASPIHSVNSSKPSSSLSTRSSTSHPVVRGFSTSHIPTFHRAAASQSKPPSLDSIPEPTSSPAAKPVQSKKQQAKFALGGSSSCDGSLSDQGPSPDVRREPVPQIKRKMFQVGGSSEEENSIKSAMHSARSSPFAQKKQTSFSNQLVTRTIPAPPVIDNDQSETEVDESAIDDDDDSSDWEDSNEESGKSSIDDKTYFQRVDSKVNLTSRRSLITLMLERNDRQSQLGNVASQSTSAIQPRRTSPNGPSAIASPNDSDEAPLMMKRTGRATHLKPINEIPRSAAQPIICAANTVNHQAALSPRTTRRNMLSTELTESLRRHLVWERSQKSSTANAVLKRRHTSHDLANLKQHPEKVVMKPENDANATSWDQDFSREQFGGYHTKGW